MRARVYVTLKPSVFDPQGRVVADALQTLGYDDVRDVRQGKFFEVELESADRAAAEARVGRDGGQVAGEPSDRELSGGSSTRARGRGLTASGPGSQEHR